MADWSVFIDETGDFEKSSIVATAGLVIPDGTAWGHATRRLKRGLLGLPWPAHAAHVNIPLLHAMGLRVHMDRDPSQTHRQQSAAWDLLGQLEAEATPQEREKQETALADLRSGCWPNLRDVALLNNVARRRAVHAGQLACYEAVATLVDDYWILVRATLRDIAGRHLVVAGEDICLDAGRDWLDVCGASDGSIQPSDTHRYFGLLGVLLQRVADVLARLPGRHTVRPCVLVRGIHGMRGLTPGHVDACARAYGVGSVAVKYAPARVVRFDDEVGAAYVLADFAANWVRGGLRWVSLSDVEGHISSDGALPVRSGEPPLSHLAASGAPRRFLDRLRAGDESSAPAGPDGLGARATWSSMQALEWGPVVAAAGARHV